MKKVSIIMPVYNGSQYIEQSIESIIKQSYENIEIILINDGSKDGSLQILYRMKNKYSNRDIKVIDQKNQGIAYTRNRGIEIAEGEFVAFIDQDDYIDSNYISELVDNILDSDIAVSGYYRSYDMTHIVREVKLKGSDWDKFMVVAPWAKLYRKDFLVKNSLKFLNVNKGEDCYFSIMAYGHTNKIVSIPYIGYYWRINETSFSNTEQKKIDDKNSLLLVLEQIRKDLPFDNCIDSKLLMYYYKKDIIYDLLLMVKGKDRASINWAKGEYFSWLNKNVPEYRTWQNIFTVPDGEAFSTKIIIIIAYMLEKLHLFNIFLRIYSRL